jgi:hypothetical protein
VKWRWLMLDYVDPDITLTRTERRQLHRSSHRHLGRIRVPLKFILAFLLIVIVPSVALFMVVNRDLIALAPAWLIIGGYVVVAHGMRALAGPAVWCALRERGYDVCLNCGYWLRGLPEDEDRCPECGAKRQPMPETGKAGDANAGP